MTSEDDDSANNGSISGSIAGIAAEHEAATEEGEGEESIGSDTPPIFPWYDTMRRIANDGRAYTWTEFLQY